MPPRSGALGIVIDRHQGVNDPGAVPASPAAPAQGSFTPWCLLPVSCAREGDESGRRIPAGCDAHLRADRERDGRACRSHTARGSGRRWRPSFGHHVDQDGAVLTAVNASARCADRERECARLRALTAAPRGAQFGSYVMPVEWMTLTPNFPRAYPTDISLVSFTDTSSVLPNAERAAVSVPLTPDRAPLSQRTCGVNVRYIPTFSPPAIVSPHARPMDPRVTMRTRS